MSDPHKLQLPPNTRTALWEQINASVEDYLQRIDQTPITPPLEPAEIRARLDQVDFDHPISPREAVDFVVGCLWDYQIHTAHPRYFGLFNPTPTTMGIAADTLTAAFNPQMAAWGHNPFAVEVEARLVRELAAKFGYDPAQADGTFATGGAEANHSALLAALTHHFPEYTLAGLRSLPKQPALYVSGETHHSFIKAARAGGLGTDYVRQVAVGDDFRLDVADLDRRIRQDLAAGLAPFMVVGTAGSTSAGIVDPLPEIAAVAADYGLWYHVDAAWGGAAVLVPELASLLNGISLSDSITVDAHKWLSVPMGAGLFLTCHPEILAETFRITTAYIPRDGAGLDIKDPYAHSIQWSRRFIGLKVYLSLAVAGWEGYANAIRHQTTMGQLLREQLAASGWEVVNPTDLPVICFVDRQMPLGRSGAFIEAVASQVVQGGQAWISVTRLNETIPVLRACITSYRASPEDIEFLVAELNRARMIVVEGQE